jgi:hypothetical protein
MRGQRRMQQQVLAALNAIGVTASPALASALTFVGTTVGRASARALLTSPRFLAYFGLTPSQIPTRCVGPSARVG